MRGAVDRDKSQGRQSQSTELVISDGVAKRDCLNGLIGKEFGEGIISQIERQRDRWTF